MTRSAARAGARAIARGLEPFDISVLGAGDHVWVSAQSRQGSVFGIARPLPDFGLPAEFGAPADWLTAAVGRARPQDEKAVVVGRALTDLVFGVPDIAALLNQTRGVAGSVGAQLLIRVLAAPQLVSSWPWELLLDPQPPDRFLTMARDVHVVRSGRSRTYAVRAAPIEPPLNLLMVMSSPLRSGPADTEAPFDLYAEKRSLLAELQPLVDRGLLAVEVEDRPTVERLRSRMAAQRRGFHVLHYLGHAQPAGLRLESPAGLGSLVRSARFAALLQQLPDLRLAVFAGCETARAPQGPNAGAEDYSTADLCVRDACPMVVGMQAVLPFGTERLFTRFFYQALTAGQPVAEALRLARLAIADDEFAGSRLLNWAVPCLFVGGSEPGPLADPHARATPPAPRPQLGLKLDARQGELRFIARLNELRQAIDVLSGRGEARLLVVWGPPGAGKTGLLDRALEELDPGVPHLSVPAGRLLAAADPVLELATLVAERIRAAGHRPAPRGSLGPDAWWERILENLAQLPFALVIDDADVLAGTEPAVARVVTALNRMTARRSRARLAVAAGQEPTRLTAELRGPEVRTVRLQALLWDEVWQWIRRNLPILTRYEERDLKGWYAKLPRLQQWEQLAEEVGLSPTASAALPDVVRKVADSLGAAAGPGGAAPPLFGASADPTAGPVSHVLRVAVAGPHTDGRAEEFATSVTTLAAEHGVAGRVAEAGSPTLESSLAELLALTTPFTKASVTVTDLTAWLDRAGQSAADVILLDVGMPTPVPEMDRQITRLAGQGRLVVAAGGNSGEPTWPGWCADALAVGGLGADGLPEPYSVYFPDAGKPELFAPGTVAGSALAAAVEDPTMRGTSAAALHAVAAAILVWATDRSLSAGDVREALLDAADLVPVGDVEIRRLNVDRALARTRGQILLDALEWGPIELTELIAEAGLPSELAIPLVEQLVAEGTLLRRVSEHGAARLENPNAVYLEYSRLRREPSGPARTAKLEELVRRIGKLAARRSFSPATVRALWDSRDDGRRIVALGIIQAVPELGNSAIVIEAITTPHSPFEQYHALGAARTLLDRLDADDRDRLRAAVTEASRPTAPMRMGADRRGRAAGLLAELGDPAPDDPPGPASTTG